MERRFSIALAARELWPFVLGGGLGRAVWAAATVLAPHADVAIVTSDRHRREYERLRDAGDPRLPEGVRFVFVPEPEDDPAPLRSWHHAWSAALLEGVRSAFPLGGPDLAEFPDYQAEGLAAIEAHRSGDPGLAATLPVLRVHTTEEVAATLNDDAVLGLLPALERIALRFAWRLLWPGGDVLGTYRRFYGEGALAPAVRTALPFVLAETHPDAGTPPPPDGPLRVLYFGRLECRKGVHHLVDAMLELPEADLRLTLMGGDTDTGPGGVSMRGHLERRAAGDERIEFRDRVALEEVAGVLRAHHVTVAPSLWESWSNVLRESLMANRPVLATPVGGMIDAVVEGRSGWLTRATGTRAVRDGLAALLDRREAIDELIAAGEPRAVLEESVDHERIVSDYRALAAEAVAAAARRPAPPGVTAVVACPRRDRARLGATLASLARQTSPVHIVAVADTTAALPGLREAELLDDALVVAPGAGFRQRARAAGLARCRTPAVAFLDAGDVLAPGFAERCARGLAEPGGPAFVAARAAGRLAPLGNAALALTGGEPPAAVLYRRDALDFELPAAAGGDEDDALLAALAERERFGAVTPEPLLTALSHARRRRPAPAPPGPPPEPPDGELWLAPWPAGAPHPVPTVTGRD